jgi:adenylate cyclase
VGDDRRRSLIPPELTGELPKFVRDLVTRHGSASETAELPIATPVDQETVEALMDLGVSKEAAIDAVRRDRVPLVIVEQQRAQEAKYTFEEAAKKGGIPADFLREMFVAMGLSVPERLTKDDVEWAKNLRALMDVLPPEAVIRSARARGNALASVARSDLGIIREEVVLPMRQAGADDLTVGVALAEAAAALEDIGKNSLIRLYELQLRAQLASEIIANAAKAEADEIPIAVGFVDVVGYTALSARVDSYGLDRMLEAFENRVIEVVAESDEVSVVKYLGDAAMLVASDSVRLAGAMLEMTTPIPELEEVPLRGGMAAGPTIVRDGDYFGAPVNMAARLTDHARPWTVLADEELYDELASVFETTRIRPIRIRGMGERRPVAVRQIRPA